MTRFDVQQQSRGDTRTSEFPEQKDARATIFPTMYQQEDGEGDIYPLSPELPGLTHTTKLTTCMLHEICASAAGLELKKIHIHHIWTKGELVLFCFLFFPLKSPSTKGGCDTIYR